MPQDASHQQRRVLFAGRVQGVGFRYTTHRLAQGREVAGFVRNLPDGRVELVVEGPRGEIEALMADIRDQFAGYIRSEETDQRPAAGLYHGFEIRH